MLTLTLLFAVLVTSGFIGRKPHERAGASERTMTVTEPGIGGSAETGATTAASVYQAQAALGFPADSASGSVTVSPRGLYRGHTAAYYAKRFRHRTRQLQNAQRILSARPSVAEAIDLAGTIYGNSATLWRKARCESHLNSAAHNGSEASGLFQFLPSTWRTTPFARFSIYSAYANALAAGWMHAQGRGGEWVCR